MLKSILPITLLALVFPVSPGSFAGDEVNVYSARKEQLIKPLLDRFSEKNGIKVNLVTGKADALLARLQSEGEGSPADLLITVDAGRLHRAQTAQLLRCRTSKFLKQNVPENYRDPEGCWFGLSLRARVIVTAKNRIDAGKVSSYEALASPDWRSKVCIRSSNNVYNQSLVASMIAVHGEKETFNWLRGLAANFARSPAGGDRDQILAVANGLCDIAVVNTYYLAMMLESRDKQHREAARAVQLVWPNQNGRGTHINVSGAAVIRNAPNPENALKLLSYLLSESSQVWYAEANHEYPIRKNTPVSETLKSWGDFKADSTNLIKLGELNTAAVMLMDKAGWK